MKSIFKKDIISDFTEFLTPFNPSRFQVEKRLKSSQFSTTDSKLDKSKISDRLETLVTNGYLNMFQYKATDKQNDQLYAR